MSVFELGFFVFIACAWPISIVRMIRNKSTKGKSVFFSSVIVLGYAFGILHKVLYDFDWVISVYILDFILVSIDTAVFIYTRNKYERKTANAV